MKLMKLYQNKIMGAISGLDRIRFRGTLRLLANQKGLSRFMSHAHILLKEFSGWVSGDKTYIFVPKGRTFEEKSGKN